MALFSSAPISFFLHNSPSLDLDFPAAPGPNLSFWGRLLVHNHQDTRAGVAAGPPIGLARFLLSHPGQGGSGVLNLRDFISGDHTSATLCIKFSSDR